MCLLPLLVVEMVALNDLGGAPGSALSQLLGGVIVAPPTAAFVRTMYLLASAGRAQVEGVLGSASPSSSVAEHEDEATGRGRPPLTRALIVAAVVASRMSERFAGAALGKAE